MPSYFFITLYQRENQSDNAVSNLGHKPSISLSLFQANLKNNIFAFNVLFLTKWLNGIIISHDHFFQASRAVGLWSKEVELSRIASCHSPTRIKKEPAASTMNRRTENIGAQLLLAANTYLMWMSGLENLFDRWQLKHVKHFTFGYKLIVVRA